MNIKLCLYLIFGLLEFGSGKTRDEVSDTHEVSYDVEYDDLDSEAQVMDIYLPRSSIESESVAIVLLHGGAWALGQKKDVDFVVPILAKAFPKFTIANLEYRLGTTTSPAYPKQIDDLESGIKYLKKVYRIQKFVLLGLSSGAHISMLHAYKDKDPGIKVIVNIVGPVDFKDPAYMYNPGFATIGFNLVGFGKTCITDMDLCEEVSPVTHIDEDSPRTISFYGNMDPLIPNSQAVRLRKKLEKEGVKHELYVFPGGHGIWEEKYMNKLKEKTIRFIRRYV